MELGEGNLTVSLRIHLLERHLQLILIHMRRMTQECIEFVQRDPVIFIDVELLENGFKALLRQEFLLVHAHHHELLQRDQTVTGAVRHRDHLVDAVFVEIGAEVLSIAVNQLCPRESAISRRVQV